MAKNEGQFSKSRLEAFSSAGARPLTAGTRTRAIANHKADEQFKFLVSPLNGNPSLRSASNMARYPIDSPKTQRLNFCS
jgi:hypothetical protein